MSAPLSITSRKAQIEGVRRCSSRCAITARSRKASGLAGTITGSPGTEESPVAYCPRRTILDKLLVDAAVLAGAQVREGKRMEPITGGKLLSARDTLRLGLASASTRERIVADIDDIVRKVRFPDWQHTSQGERLVQKELRRTLLKYKLHSDQELFDKAYEYIRQYY